MKLDTKRVFYVGLAFFLISIFWQIYDNIIPKILMDKFGMGHTLSGFIMAIDNILALTLLPLFGALSDRTNHKLGRRTPYIIIGTVVAAFLFVGLTFVDNVQLRRVEELEVPEAFAEIQPALENASRQEAKDLIDGVRAIAWRDTVENPTTLIVFMVMLLIVLIAMSSFRSPAVALMPDVTVKPLRSKANAIINLMGAAAGAMALVIMMALAIDSPANRYISYTLLFVIVAAIMLIALVVFLIKVKEPKFVKMMEEEKIKYNVVDEEEQETTTDELPKDKKRSLILILISIFLWFMGYNAVTSKFSIYAGDVLQMGFTIPLLIAQVSAIAAFIPVGIVSTKIGRKKVIMFGVVLLTVAFGFAFFLTPNTASLMYLVLFMAGVGWASINVNSFPMVAELSKGSNVGKYTGYYYAFSMSAQAITPWISGYLMEYVFTDHVLFPYATVFVALAFCTMFFVKHGDAKPVPAKSAIEYLDVDD